MFDLQVNGLTTKDFSCDFWQSPNDKSIHALRKHEYTNGISMFLATLITGPYEAFEKNLDRIKEYKKKHDNDFKKSSTEKLAHIFGVHIEGGLISKMGIHPEAYAQTFNLQNIKELVKKYPGLIKLWTLCPKMDTNGDVTKFLQDQGIKVAYGHSDASFDEAMNAFDKYGVDLVTHWCNGMKTFPGFKHRGGTKADVETLENLVKAKTNSGKYNEIFFELNDSTIIDRNEIGIAVAAYHNPKIYVTAIAGSKAGGDEHIDGYLLHKLAEKKKGKFILVSDSVAQEKPRSNKNFFTKLKNFYLNIKKRDVVSDSKHESQKLRGGLTTLDKHALNAMEAMVEIEDVQAATSITPYEVMGIKP